MTGAAFVLLMAGQLFGGGETNTREGAEHFEAGRLEEALRAFSRAEGAYPEAPENDLNIAGVHYRMGEAEGGAGATEDGPLAEALRGYQAALQSGVEGDVRRDALFNLGNGLFRAGAFREAASAYGEAIAEDPEDLAARQNLERALRRAEEQEQQQRQQPGGESQDGQQQDEEDQQQPEGEAQPQDQPPGEGQEQQDSSSEESERQDRENPPGESPERPEQPSAGPEGDAPPGESAGADAPGGAPGEVPEISPEQAERILAALADVERAFQQEQLERRRARALRRGRH